MQTLQPVAHAIGTTGCIGAHDPGSDWLFSCWLGQNVAHGVEATLTFSQTTITRIVLNVDAKSTTSSNTDKCQILDGEGNILAEESVPDNQFTPLTIDIGDISIPLSEIRFRCWAASLAESDDAHTRITSIHIEGMGTEPF